MVHGSMYIKPDETIQYFVLYYIYTIPLNIILNNYTKGAQLKFI